MCCSCGRVGFGPSGGDARGDGDDASAARDDGGDGTPLPLTSLVIDPVATTSMPITLNSGLQGYEVSVPDVLGGRRGLMLSLNTSGSTTISVDVPTNSFVYSQGATSALFAVTYPGISGDIALASTSKIRIVITAADAAATPAGLVVRLQDAAGGMGEGARVVTGPQIIDIELTDAGFASVDLTHITYVDVQLSVDSAGGNLRVGPFTIVP
jgi:hypothetical protein